MRKALPVENQTHLWGKGLEGALGDSGRLKAPPLTLENLEQYVKVGTEGGFTATKGARDEDDRSPQCPTRLRARLETARSTDRLRRRSRQIHGHSRQHPVSRAADGRSVRVPRPDQHQPPPEPE